jgi:hypothetical protein
MTGSNRYIMVNEKPFFVLGGQVHNSSAYTKDSMAPLWDVLMRMRANTAEAPVYWEQIEPEEGAFDFSIVDDLIAGARAHELRLILLWFATWKNGTMKYAPRWVKLQPDRFRRVITADGFPLPVLSPHCPATLAADMAAFHALIAHIKEADADERTVIAVQIENEPGSYGSERDYSSEGNALFAAEAPPAITSLLPTIAASGLQRTWTENGSRASGTWDAVFGQRAAEVFTAWHVARYIDAIAEAARAVYDVPLYVNVWLGENGFRNAGYDYPSGGAVSDLIPLWKAAAPHVDILAPDIYLPDTDSFHHICAAYSRADNPLLIPECGLWPATARQIFYAIAEHNAIGIAPFGIDSLVDEDGAIVDTGQALVDSFAATRAILPLIPPAQETGRLHAIVQEEGAAEQFIELEGYNALVRFGLSWYGRRAPECGGIETAHGRGLLVQTGPKEFYVTGVGFTVYLRPTAGVDRMLRADPRRGQLDPWLLVEAGRFEGDRWVVDGRRAGDESDFGLVMAVPGQAVHAVFD